MSRVRNAQAEKAKHVAVLVCSKSHFSRSYRAVQRDSNSAWGSHILIHPQPNSASLWPLDLFIESSETSSLIRPGNTLLIRGQFLFQLSRFGDIVSWRCGRENLNLSPGRLLQIFSKRSPHREAGAVHLRLHAKPRKLNYHLYKPLHCVCILAL